jgi:hypothetical protein
MQVIHVVEEKKFRNTMHIRVRALFSKDRGLYMRKATSRYKFPLIDGNYRVIPNTPVGGTESVGERREYHV